MNKSFWSLYLIPLLALSISLNAEDMTGAAPADVAAAAPRKHKGKHKVKGAVQAEPAAAAPNEGMGKKRKHHGSNAKAADKGSKAKKHHQNADKEHHEGEEHHRNHDGGRHHEGKELHHHDHDGKGEESEHHHDWSHHDEMEHAHDPASLSTTTWGVISLKNGSTYFNLALWKKDKDDAHRMLLMIWKGLHHDPVSDKCTSIAAEHEHLPHWVQEACDNPHTLNLVAHQDPFDAAWDSENSIKITCPMTNRTENKTDKSDVIVYHQYNGQVLELTDVTPSHDGRHIYFTLNHSDHQICYSVGDRIFFDVESGNLSRFIGSELIPFMLVEKFPEAHEHYNRTRHAEHGEHDEKGEMDDKDEDNDGDKDHDGDNDGDDDKDAKVKKGGKKKHAKGGAHAKEMKHKKAKKGAAQEGADAKPEHKKKHKKSKKSEANAS